MKTNKIGLRFSHGEPPAKPAKQEKTSSSWKIIEVTHSRRSGRGRGSGVIIILLKLFSSKFLILFTDVPRRRSPPEIAARWRNRLPSNNLTAHYNSQFCVSFNSGLDQEAQKCFVDSWKTYNKSLSTSRGRGDYSKLFLARVVFGAFCHNKSPYIFFSKNSVWPPYRGSEKRTPHYVAKNENHHRGSFDSLNEAFWCTDCNAKKLQLSVKFHSGQN